MGRKKTTKKKAPTKAELKSQLDKALARLAAEERLVSRLKQRVASYEAAADESDESKLGTLADTHYELSKCGIPDGNLACRVGVLIGERDKARADAKAIAERQESTTRPQLKALAYDVYIRNPKDCSTTPTSTAESLDYLRGRLEATERAHDALLKRAVFLRHCVDARCSEEADHEG